MGVVLINYFSLCSLFSVLCFECNIQCLAAIEDGEVKESQRKAALARAQQAEGAAVIAQKARKEAENACRALDAAESKARIEAEAEKRQRLALMEQLKSCMRERDAALSNSRMEDDQLVEVRGFHDDGTGSTWAFNQHSLTPLHCALLFVVRCALCIVHCFSLLSSPSSLLPSPFSTLPFS